MKTGTTRIAQFLGFLLFSWSPLASAAIPDGVMVFQFNGGNVYDFSSFRDCESLLGITLCLDVDMVPDGKGKHTGTASLEFSGAVDGLLVGPASGSVSGKVGDKGKAKLKMKTTGNLDIPGEGLTKTKIKLNCSGKISPTGFLATVCKILVKIKGLGSETGKATYDNQLNGGNWTLTIDVDPVNEKKFAGTGTDSLGYSYKVKGKYNAKNETSKVKATGLKKTASKGAMVELKGLDAEGAARAKFKVQGYKGKTKVQAEPSTAPLFNYSLYDDFSASNGSIDFSLWNPQGSATAASSLEIVSGALIATAVKDGSVRANQGLWVANATNIALADFQAFKADFTILESTGDTVNRAQILLGFPLDANHWVDTGINFYPSGDVRYFIEIFNNISQPITSIASGTIATVDPALAHTLAIDWDDSNYIFQVDSIEPIVVPMTGETDISTATNWGWAAVRSTAKDAGTGTSVVKIDNVYLGGR